MSGNVDVTKVVLCLLLEMLIVSSYGLSSEPGRVKDIQRDLYVLLSNKIRSEAETQYVVILDLLAMCCFPNAGLLSFC